MWSKLAETSPLEEDGDTDFAGLYTSCTACDTFALDAYWLWLRDAQAANVAPRLPLLGVNDYETTNLHTIGLRAAGETGPWDYGAEAAYQLETQAEPVRYSFQGSSATMAPITMPGV